jgi:WD40 repeat protein
VVIVGFYEGASVLAWRADGRLLAMAAFRDEVLVRIWDTELGGEREPPSGVAINAVTTVAFSPDGRHLACGGAECSTTIHLWTVAER